MTHSGQGEEPHLPSVRQPREGIVLPADGSGPVVPGTAGDQTTPAGGTPWGEPWGPDSTAMPPTAPPTAPGQAWGPASGAAEQPPAAYGYPHQPMDAFGQQSLGGAPLPPAAGPVPLPPAADPVFPPPGAPNGPGEGFGPHGAGASAGAGYGYPGGALPPSSGPGDASPHAPHASYGAQPHAPQGTGQVPSAMPHPGGLPPAGPGPLPPVGAGPLPPADPAGRPDMTGAQGPGGAHAGPLPGAHGSPVPPAGPAGDEAATQYLPPIAGGGPGAPSGPGGPGAPAGSGGPGGHGMPGALPPELPADATQQLGRVPRHPGANPQGGPGVPGGAARPGPGADPDNQPTQYIAPVPGGPQGAPYGVRPGAPGAQGAGAGLDPDGGPGRQPPAEFDNLFRTQPGPGEAASTQQLPRIDHPQGPGPAPQGPYAPGYGGEYGGPGGYAPAGYDDDERPAKRSKAPLIAVGVGIVVLGVGVGALLSTSGGDKPHDDARGATTAPADTGSPSADPAEAQATQLDKLLADSNNSRDAVINAVANVKACKNLGQSATDLRNAAKQRNGLVTRLSGVAVDQLPDHDKLTSALNDAWHASASADNHYAAWADQIAGNKKACHKGHARNTAQAGAGNKASGEATEAKGRAADLWNVIANKYGLTTRDKSQL
ncbi:hypothetical protein [Streptomyces odontomachi]|uniref:hypothetical protein n=1 Tax=Streptomyces odontomachi TaxID=2944940 RepID=UPI00210F15BF|nr:hypothetical protein [Streptomyces sp. ODS25]